MADTLGPNLRKSKFSQEKQDGGPSSKSSFEKLMDRLRRQEGWSSSWAETSRTLKLCMAERKIVDDSMKSSIGDHLQTLQREFKVHGFSGVSERLERIAVTLGLRFTRPAKVDHLFRTCLMESECFRIDVVLDSGGTAKDVFFKHEGDRDGPARCFELTKLINEGKFEEVKNHISGILAIYNIGADKKQKSRAFFTLQALETDLMNLSKFQSSISNVSNLILKSPLGIVVPRVAGRAMKCVYFVPPYDLVDEKSNSVANLTIESVTENSLGHSLTVTIEPSSPHKLQCLPLLSTTITQDGKSLPSFMPLTKNNSCWLPAVFTLQLSQPLPVAYSVIRAMQNATGLELPEVQEKSYKPLTELIVQNALKDTPYESDVLSVVLPDQKHSYSLNCCNNCDDYRGAMVTQIPFLHPTDVARVIQLLRQQALYNTIIGSCVRKHASSGSTGALTLDVTAVSMHAISVMFEHPYTDTVTTVGFDLSDLTGIRCSLFTSGSQSDNNHEHTATSVFQRCLSLPVTMRYVARALADKMEESIKSRSPSPPPNDIRFVPKKLHSTLQLSKLGQERRAAFAESRALRDGTVVGYNTMRVGPYSNLNSHGAPYVPSSSNIVNTGPIPVAARNRQINIPIPTPASLNAHSTMTQHGLSKTPGITATKVSHNSQSVISPDVDDLHTAIGDSATVPTCIDSVKKDKIKKNPMLASLLDQERESPEPVPNSQQPHSMLSQLLGDAAPDPTGVTMPLKGPMQAKPQQKRKRRSMGDSQGSVSGLHNQVGVGPKRLASEEDILTNMNKGYPSLNPAEHQPSQHAMPNNIDTLLNNQAHQHQVGNFHIQTRVGGGNSVYYASSSHQSNLTNSNPVVSSNRVEHPSQFNRDRNFSEESHVSRLASSVDNFMKQGSLEANSSCANVVSTVISSSSPTTSPRTVPSSFYPMTSSLVNTSAQNTQLSHTSHNNAHRSHLYQQQTDSRITTPHQPLASSQQQHFQQQISTGNLVSPVHKNNSLNNEFFQKPQLSELVSLLSDDSEIKQEPKFSESKSFLNQSFPVKEEPHFSRGYSTVDDSLLKSELSLDSDSVFRGNLDSVTSNRTKSFEYDPFEFTESFLGPQPGVDGAFDSTNTTNLGIEFSDQKPIITPSLNATTTPKHTSSNVDIKHHIHNMHSKNSEDHPKKERKKTIRENDERQDKLANVSMKININTKTNTIVRASPHRSESPMDGVHTNTPDIASHESSRDSDVFITYASNSKNSVEHCNSSRKSGKKSESSSKKKKKGSKHDGDVKHERKRKRDEERLKAEQVKKQKVYDFEFNESEHLPPIKPTKIKIRTFDGKMQIQTSTSTSTKKLTMSPLPMKAAERSDSPTHGSTKSHKSEKSKHRHSSSKHNRAKSGSSQSGKIEKDVDAKLHKTPVVKIKPLFHAPQPNSASTPQSAPVQLNLNEHHVNKANKVQVTNANSALGKKSPNCLVDGGRSKSLSHVMEARKAKDVLKMDSASGEQGKSLVANAMQMTNKNTVASHSSAGDKYNCAVGSVDSGSKLTSVVTESNSKVKYMTPTPTSSLDKSHPSKSRTVLNSTNTEHTPVNASSKMRVNSQDSTERMKNSSNGASSEDSKRTSVYNSIDKSRISSQSSDLDSKKSKALPSTDMKSRTGQNSIVARPLVNSTTDSKSRNSVLNAESNRARTPTHTSNAENKVRSASSSSAQNNSSDGAKNRSLLASVNPVSGFIDASRMKINSSDKDGVKLKHEKSQNPQSSADSQRNKPQNRQRKSSLDQVISKLTKGRDNDTSAPPKKAQELYDQLRLEILKAGDHKQSTPGLSMKKIGKIAKQEAPSVNSPVTTMNAVPAKSSTAIANAIPKSNLSKQSPNFPSSKRSNKDSNKSHFRIPTNKVDNKVNSNKSELRKNNSLSCESKSSSDNKDALSSYRRVPDPHMRQNQSGNQHQRQSSREGDEKNKRFKIDDISERLQSRHFLDAVIKPSDDDSSGSHQKSSSLQQKHSSHQVNHDKQRSKGTVVKGSKHNSNLGKPGINPVNKNKVTSQSSKVNSSHRHQQSNRSKTPVNLKSNAVPKSSRDPRTAGGDVVNAKVSPTVNADSNLPEKVLSVSASTPDSPPPTFYNPAQALKRKASANKPATVPLSKPAVVPLDKPAIVPLEKTKIVPLEKPMIVPLEKPTIVPLDKPTIVPLEKPTIVPLEKPTIVPLDKRTVVPSNKAPVVNEIPLSPIRHETPPASPLMARDLSHNKENVAKAIPLNDKVLKQASPISNPQSPDEIPSASSIPFVPVKVIPKTNLKSKPLSPRSDISSPECSLIIDYPNSPVDANSKAESAPKTIPLERSQSRSPPSPQSPSIAADSELDMGKKVKIIECVMSPSLVLRDSPCSIDDGLMDEALSL